MTVAGKEALIALAMRTMEVEPLADAERSQMWALDKLAGNEDDRLILRTTFWERRAEILGAENY